MRIIQVVLVRGKNSFFRLCEGFFVVVHNGSRLALRIVPLAYAFLQFESFLDFREAITHLFKLLAIVSVRLHQNVLQLHFFVSLLVLYIFLVLRLILARIRIQITINLLALDVMKFELIVTI